jgi:hypothetical protein
MIKIMKEDKEPVIDMYLSDVPQDDHRKAKARAAMEGISLTEAMRGLIKRYARGRKLMPGIGRKL